MKSNRPNPGHANQGSISAQHGVARVISKRGICSRSQAEALVRDGQVRVAGRVIRDPYTPTRSDAEIIIEGAAAAPVQRRYLILNKPRGMVTTASDESGRATVYACFEGNSLPWLAPVGRLDKASEGLLLFSNDSEWAARIAAPESHLNKTYHVQIDRLPDAPLMSALQFGIEERGERLAAVSVRELRRGEKNAWLEIVLDEGRNRQIRRLLSAFDVSVLRLIRVAIGPLALGDLAKGKWRELSDDEVTILG
ncbi:MAG: pseudouridine synthase [Dokdonella sp.]